MAIPLTVGVCGTTDYSAQCAEALRQDPRFAITWVLTPHAKPVGRQQVLTDCALARWAQAQHLSHFTVETDLASLQSPLTAQPPVDFLLVVAFGYRLPDWMLQLPSMGAINVHPSRLPDYRGASPGQFVLLYGEATSAVSIMEMNATFDTGAVIAQPSFPVSPTMTQTEYYDQAFALAEATLPETLIRYANDRSVTAQPATSATPYARRLTRDDGFFPWSALVDVYKNSPELSAAARTQLPIVLQNVLSAQKLSPAQLLDRVYRAFHPWPGVWTTLPEYKGRTQVRCKLLAVQFDGNKATITQWQPEGEIARSDTFPITL
jgi:methionyl-tRNA formyltransferase